MTPFLSRFLGENGIFDIPLKPAVSIADSHECMLRRVAPTSNTERQRQFRERNPGYYGRLHAKRRAESDAIAAQRLAMAKVTVEHREPLALPAPAILVDIPGMTTIPERRERSPVPIAIEEYALR